MNRVKELTLITKIKRLSSVIFGITERSPKRYRFTLVSRMQNLALDILSDIYMANDTFIDMKIIEDMNKSIDHAKKAGKTANDEKFYFRNKQFELKLARTNKIEERVSKRLDYSYAALTKVKVLDYLIVLSEERGCITKPQQERLAKELCDVRNLIGAFIKSYKKRYNY